MINKSAKTYVQIILIHIAIKHPLSYWKARENLKKKKKLKPCLWSSIKPT